MPKYRGQWRKRCPECGVKFGNRVRYEFGLRFPRMDEEEAGKCGGLVCTATQEQKDDYTIKKIEEKLGKMTPEEQRMAAKKAAKKTPVVDPLKKREPMRTWIDKTPSPKVGYAGGPPEHFEYHTESMKITVCRHIHHPGKWVMHCRELGISEKELDAVEAQKAREEAFYLLELYVNTLMGQLGFKPDHHHVVKHGY